jgi:hypothetical protein
MHNDTSVGNLFSSKFTIVLLSAAGFLLFGAAGFLNGSAPDAFAHWWQRKPGPGLAAMVYFVYNRH